MLLYNTLKTSILGKYRCTFLCLLYLLIITFLGGDHLFSITTIVAMFSSFSILVILNILSKFKYSFLFTILLIIIVSFDAFFSLSYNTYITLPILSSVFDTDMNEATEAFGQYSMRIVLIIIITSFLVIKAQKELTFFPFSKLKSSLCLIVYFVLFIPIVAGYKLDKNKKEDANHFHRIDPILAAEPLVKAVFPVVYGDVFTYGVYKYEKYRIEEYIKNIRILPNDIALDESRRKPAKIYFVIGETARRDHFSLYGYNVKTTPFLDSLYNLESVDFNFYQGLAPAPITREALRIVLSFASPLDASSLFEYKNVVELAKDAGYETLWISNQDAVGVSDGYVGFISSCADFRSFRDRMDENGKPEDLNLVEILKMKHLPDKNQMFFINLMGSHASYDARYDSIDRMSIEGEGITVDYDRSIHHTDRVLMELYNVMEKDTSAVLCYFSDHGEVIGKGHILGSQQDYRIPLFVISNDSVIVNADNVMEKYINTKTGCINTTSCIYSVAEIMGYSVPEKYVTKTVSEGEYVLDKDYNPEYIGNIKEGVDKK